jgi:hypothetical protein
MVSLNADAVQHYDATARIRNASVEELNGL